MHASAQWNPPAKAATGLKLTPQLEPTLPFRCPIVPTHSDSGLPNSVADHGLPQHKKYVKPNHAAAYVFSPSPVRSLLRSRSAPQRRRNPASAVPSDSTPTQQSLPHEDVEHPAEIGLLDCMSPVRSSSVPLSDAKCPTVHRSTSNPSIVNPRRYMSPRRPTVYQKRAAGSRYWKL